MYQPRSRPAARHQLRPAVRHTDGTVDGQHLIQTHTPEARRTIAQTCDLCSLNQTDQAIEMSKERMPTVSVQFQAEHFSRFVLEGMPTIDASQCCMLIGLEKVG